MQHPSRWFVLALAVGACTQGSPRMETAAANLEVPPPDEVSAVAGAQDVADTPAPDPITVAMSAAPPAIGRNATIMQLNAAGELVELRPGTNGWLCIPDENPAAPGNAPMCMDQHWQAWMDAFMAGEPPAIDGVGTSYMLQGGPVASNTDPLAQGPPAGSDWLYDGPHLMIIVPDPAMLDGYPTEHGIGAPYVMWAGTPYAHLMVPAGGM